MWRRCCDTKNPAFPNYGGRGITVCEDWRIFATFREWAMLNGYERGLEIDRRDNDGPYSPNNCRWVTHRQNSDNQRKTVKLNIDGEIITVSDAAKRFGISPVTIRSRLRRGWTDTEAVLPA